MTDVLMQVGLSNGALAFGLAIVAWVVHRTGRVPAVAHLLWVLVLVKLVTPPLWHVPVVPGAATAVDPVVTMEMSIEAESAAVFAPDALASDFTAASPVSHASTPTGVLITRVLIGVWLVGSFVVFAGSFARITRFRRLLQVASKDASPRVQSIADEVVQRFGVRRAPRIDVTPGTISPLVCWFGGRVRIVLPAGLVDAMDDDALRWVLAHEMAHVRRRDHVVRWIEWLACVAFWWNPVTWWARRNLRINEELCCDALVLSRLDGRPSAYANALLHVVEFLAAPVLRPPVVASAMNSGGSLEARFRMILSNDGRRRAPRWMRACVFAAAVGVMPLGFAQADRSDEAMVEVLRDGVASGAMDVSEARKVFDETVFPDSEVATKMRLEMERMAERIRRATESGRLTAIEAEKKLHELQRGVIEQRYMMFATDVLGMTKGEAQMSMMREHLAELVVTGEITQADADEKLAEMERAMDLRAEYTAHMEVVKAEIEAAIEAGTITPEEGRRKLASMKDAIGLRMRVQAQIEEIKAAVEAGILTAAEAEEKIAAIQARVESHRRAKAVDWEAITRKIEHAVETGEMTAEEAQAAYRKIRAEMEKIQQDRVARQAGEQDRREELMRRAAEALMGTGVDREDVRPLLREIHGLAEQMLAGEKELDLSGLNAFDLDAKQTELAFGLAKRVAAMSKENAGR